MDFLDLPNPGPYRSAVTRVFLLLLVAGLTGCQTAGYYKQAIQGQYQVLKNRRLMSELIADPQTPASLKEQFQLILKLREFATTELKLPVNGHYQSYVDLHRRYVVWTVHAAPEFSLQPKTWWYPVVGSLKYRGYFSERDARHYAGTLTGKDFDVYVDGVEAYSTLGWFKDPVLNTFINHREPELAEIIFHELAHQREFVRGDTDFNEAFATAVAREGVRRWLTFRNDAPALDRFQANRPAETAVIKLILAARKQLETLYTEDAARPINELREAKAKVIEQLRANYHALRERLPHFPDYDAWMTAPINNAKLNTIDTYYQLVPSFEARLLTLNGNLTAFYENIASTRNLTQADRRRGLAQEPGTVVRLR